MLKPDLPMMDDPEGVAVPVGLPPVMDAHVHVFPDEIFPAIWDWFDTHAWQIRYRMTTREIFEFLLSRGISHIIALQYAHKPGMARYLNTYLAEQCSAFPGKVTGLATVFPGEPDAVDILESAFNQGLGGVKLHAHVQCFDMNSTEMDEIYQCCRDLEKPMVMHVGREPKSSAYRCDPYEICRADKLENVLKNFPDLRICVPHLGFDEIEAYRKLTENYDNLWLDTTMVLTDYFQIEEEISLERYRSDRIIYGSDFPNIPYAWDRELNMLSDTGLSRDQLEGLCWKNGYEFFYLNRYDNA